MSRGLTPDGEHSVVNRADVPTAVQGGHLAAPGGAQTAGDSDRCAARMSNNGFGPPEVGVSSHTTALVSMASPCAVADLALQDLLGPRAGYASTTPLTSAGRSRHQAALRDLERIAEQLFARLNPHSSSPLNGVKLRKRSRFYAASVIQPLDKRLIGAVENSGLFYLQAEKVGVGASLLLSDFGNAFNARAQAVGDPRRIARVALTKGTKTSRNLLDALSVAAQAPLSVSELRFRDTGVLGNRIAGALAQLQVCTLIVDHIHRATAEIQETIADMVEGTDPDRGVRLNPLEPAMLPAKIGFIFASHLPPETAFLHEERLSLGVRAATGALRRYRTTEQFAEALRLADIGMEDCDANDPDDQIFIKEVRRLTEGRLILMDPLFSMVDSITRASGTTRPCLTTLTAAMKYYQVVAERAKRYAKEQETEVRHGRAPSSGSRTSAIPRRSAALGLKAKRDSVGIAHIERRDMNRHDHTVLPNLPPDGVRESDLEAEEEGD